MNCEETIEDGGGDCNLGSRRAASEGKAYTCEEHQTTWSVHGSLIAKVAKSCGLTLSISCGV
jgi:hypothetical protein